MNINLNQHESYITTPDDSAKVEHEALPPDTQPKVVIPGPIDPASGPPPGARLQAFRRSKYHGMALAWRGLHVLSAGFGIAAVWFVAAWVRHGRMPLCRPPQSVETSFVPPPGPILPPRWLVAILALSVLVSFCMILVGTQDAIPKMKAGKRDDRSRR